MLTPDFGTVKNLINMSSNEEVIYIKKFRVVDINIFEVWVIAIRSHLILRFCIQNTIRLITPSRQPRMEK